MELQLKNVGMIKEANVKIDGLTVIAGENDTGKSTVGKALLVVFYNYLKRKNEGKNIISYYNKKIFKNIMKFSFSNDSLIRLEDGDKIITYHYNFYKISFDKPLIRAIMIETPIIMNFYDFFSRISNVQDEIDYDISNYPYTFKLLYKRLSLPLKYKNESSLIVEKINNIINGNFEIENDDIFFYRKNKKYEVNSVATGIKSFGILQLLAKNGYLKKNNILILDEPEVHLHPKWQLEMAKVIVELVKNGVKVLVNSHSPYMIEALKRYSELEEQEDKTNFYLAEDGSIKHQDNLENIFEKLAKPMRELKKIKMQKYLNE